MCTKLIHNTLLILFCQNKEQLCNGIPKLFVIYNNSPILTPYCVPMNVTIVTNFQDFGETHIFTAWCLNTGKTLLVPSKPVNEHIYQ